MASKFIASEDNLNRILEEKYLGGFRSDYLSVDGYFFPKNFQSLLDRIENFEVREDDVWVCSFPKNGTTWTQEMVWNIANDLDYNKAKMFLTERFPFLEISGLLDFKTLMENSPGKVEFPASILDSVKFTDEMPSPRFIKSHLPFQLLPKQIRTGEKNPKIIHVYRNVKDTCISFFHHNQILGGFTGTLEEFCTLFLAGKVTYGPYWKHVLSYWERRNQKNILIFKFEDMKTDLRAVINKTSEFLGKKALTENEMKDLEKHLSFENMKTNPAVNYEQVIKKHKKMNLTVKEGNFIRSGKVNQWKERMSQEMIDNFDSLTEEYFKDTNLFT